MYIPLLGDSELCLQPEDHSLTPWLHTEVLWAWLSPLCTFLALQILVSETNLKHEPQRLKNDIKKQCYDLALLKNLWVPFNGVALPYVRKPHALAFKFSFLPLFVSQILWFGKTWPGCREQICLRSPPWTFPLGNRACEDGGDGHCVKCGGGCHFAVTCYQSPPLTSSVTEERWAPLYLSQWIKRGDHKHSREQK